MVEILIAIGLTLISLVFLVKGADFLIDGAADFARWMKVSPILVGLTVVAFGTSLPEFIVSLFSVLGDKADISIGNVIGSNIANIALVIGICAMIVSLETKSKTLIYEFPFLIVSTFLLLILGNDNFIFNQNNFLLGRFDGMIFILIFLFFIYYVFRSIKNDNKSVEKEFAAEIKHDNSTLKNTLLIIGGIVGLFIGGKMFITAASDLAKLAGLSDAFVGLVIAALGTSLPELFASGMAAWRGHGDLAIGNIVGSNIFNVLFVLGVTSLIKPIPVNSAILGLDGMIMLAVTLLFLVFATSNKKLHKLEGAGLVTFYVMYLAFLIIRL